MKKESAHIGYRQYLHGKTEAEQNYKRDNTYKKSQRKIIIRNIFRHLNQLENPKFRVENRVTLAKFPQFVVPEDQD